ncbi:MAG: hypothetical protein QME68_05930 [Elusimicrobiota bacterium]|nr:hypothetical protein [Elusimicrobiota bacterium]
MSDYFRKDKITYYKTTKVLTEFLQEAEKNAFEIINSEDITQNILPTLDLAKMLYNRYGLPIVEMLSGYCQFEHPAISKIVGFLFRNKKWIKV